MLKVFLFAIFFFLLIFIFCKLTQKYVNPYKLIFVFGKKGSGKSTLLTKLAYKYRKKIGTCIRQRIYPVHLTLITLKQFLK